MADFPALPKKVDVPLQTAHTALLAVFGEENRDNSLHVSASTGGLHFHLHRNAGKAGKAEEGSAWAFGETKVQGVVRGQYPFGRAVGTTPEGLYVAKALDRVDEGTAFEVWRGSKQVRTLIAPGDDAALAFHHLCVCTEDDAIVAADLRDTKSKFVKVGALPKVKEGEWVRRWFGPGPEGQLAVVCRQEISTFDLGTGKQRLALRGPKGKDLGGAAFNADGSLVVASESALGGKKKALFFVLDGKSGKLLATLDTQKLYCRDAAFVDHGRLLATTAADGTLALWDVGTWKLLETLKLDRPNEAAGAPGVIAWDAHDAMIFVTSKGLAYLFSVHRTVGGEASVVPADPKPAPKKKLPPSKEKWTSSQQYFALGKTGDDTFGGIPQGIAESEWPACKNCEQPMTPVLTLGKHAQRLPLRQHAGITLFICSGGSCDSFDPANGASAALLRTSLAGPPLKTAPVGSDGKTELLKPRRVAFGAKKTDSWVGGSPEWLQADETPRCPTCTAKMGFVAQLSEELDDRLNFASGIGYLFVCPGEHEASFLWQS